MRHQLRMFSQNGQKGWPSRSSQSRQYWRTSSGGRSIGGPTRPGVSFSACVPGLVGVDVVVVHAPHHVASVATDVDVFRLRREAERVDREVGLEEAPVGLRLDDAAASPPWAAPAGRATGDISATSSVRIAVEEELGHDLLHPGRAGLGVGGDDDVVVAEREVVPDRRVEVMVVQLARLPRPLDVLVHGLPLANAARIASIRFRLTPRSE